MNDVDPYHWVGAPTPRGDPMKREPVLTVASITALVAAVVTLLVAFGFPLNGDQQTAILGVAAVAAPLLVALFSRPRVTPVEPVARVRGAGGQSALYIALTVLVVVVIVLLLFGR